MEGKKYTISWLFTLSVKKKMKSLLTLLSCAFLMIVHAQVDTINYAGFNLYKNDFFVKREKVTVYKVNEKEVSKAEYEKALAKVNEGKKGLERCKPCWLRYYDANNKLIQEGLSYQDCGVGKAKEYFQNGKLKSEGSYKVNETGNWDNLFDRGYCSIKEGIWIFYKEDGTIAKKEEYRDGVLLSNR